MYYSTQIGKGVNIQHGVGIVIGPRYTIGENFLIHQRVTLGQQRNRSEVIKVDNNVTVFAGAKLLENIVVGDNVNIAVNAILISNAESNGTYIGIPAKRLDDRKE